MKKLIFIILIITSILSVSCNEDHDNVYEVKLTMGIEGGIFKSSSEIYEIDDVTTNVTVDSEEKVINVGNCKINAKLMEERTYKNSGKQYIYQSNDGNIRYGLSETSDSFYIAAQNDVNLSEYDEDNLTEEKLINHVKSYIDKYIGKDYIAQYTYSCSTSVITVNDESAWRENKSGFYISDSKNEQIVYYNMEFIKYVNGMQTADRIEVQCDNYGNVKRFYFNKYDADWSSVTVDQTKVIESLESFLNRNINSEYDIVSYEIQKQYLTYMQSKIYLSVDVGVTLNGNDNELVVLCPLRISVD